jgi:hypothetical protein
MGFRDRGFWLEAWAGWHKGTCGCTTADTTTPMQVVGLSLMREFDEELCSEALSLIHTTVDQMVDMEGWWVGLPPGGPQRLFCHTLVGCNNWSGEHGHG